MKARVRVVSLRYFDHVVSSLSPRAFRVYAMAMQWSCYHATDGVLTPDDIETIGAKPAQLEELFKRRLLELDDQGRTVLGELTRGPFVAEVEGSEVEHDELEGRKPASIRQARWRANRRRLHVDAQPSTPSRHEVDADPSTVSTSTASTPALPLASPSDLSPSGSSSSPDPEGSSTLTSSDPWGLTGSARDSGKRASRGARRRGTDEPIPEGFPSPEVLDALLVYGRKKGLRDGQIRDEIEGLVLWAKAGNEKKSDWIAAAQGWLRRHANGSAPGSPRPVNGSSAGHVPAPYHAPIDTRPREDGLKPEEQLAALRTAMAGIGRRVAP